MKKEDLRRLQNHFDNGIKDGYQAKVHYQNGDRVHLKGTNVNGTITGVVFKDDRKFPYLKIKWDNIPVNYEINQLLQKKFYDPYEVTKEIKLKHKEETKKKNYDNFYLKERK